MRIEGVIRNLRVRPSQSSDLSFNMPGIIARQNGQPGVGGLAVLGSVVPEFDIESVLYRNLGEVLPASKKHVAGARLKYDSREIHKVMASKGGPFLFVLRNESIAAALDQMINRRENAFLERFMHAKKIQQRMKKSYPEIIARLQNVITNTQQRHDLLEQEYISDGIGFKKEIATQINTEVPLMGMSSSAISNDLPVGNEIETKIEDQGGQVVQRHKSQASISIPRFRDASGKWIVPGTQTVQSQSSNSKARDGQYSHPPLDNSISTDQQVAQLHLELLKHETESHRIDHIVKILSNELNAIDQEIRGLQVNYAHTFLFSSFEGAVTAVYKDVGESVEPGEPVIRIEKDGYVYAVGRIQFRGKLQVGDIMEVVAEDLFETAQKKTIKGKLVSIRGHEIDNDEWEVIVVFKNPVHSGVRLLPLNYQFDPDTTKIARV